MGHRHGEEVKLSLVSADASGGVALVVSDSNGKNRPIQSWERLILDMINGSVLTTTIVTITDPGAVNDSLLGVVTLDVGLMIVPAEGMSLSIGSTPLATASAAGAVAIIGSGRVINGNSQGVRPNYRELLTPGGNIGGI
jgi:hypothetical protein